MALVVVLGLLMRMTRALVVLVVWAIVALVVVAVATARLVAGLASPGRGSR